METVTDPVRAREDGAPLVHETGNLLKHIQVRKGDVGRGFEQAEVILEDEYFTPTTEHAYMEPECSIARPVSGGRLEIYVGSQIPYSDRSQVAACLKMPVEKVRIIGTLIGGGVGGEKGIAGPSHAAPFAQAHGRARERLHKRH